MMIFFCTCRRLSAWSSKETADCKNKTKPEYGNKVRNSGKNGGHKSNQQASHWKACNRIRPVRILSRRQQHKQKQEDDDDDDDDHDHDDDDDDNDDDDEILSTQVAIEDRCKAEKESMWSTSGTLRFTF